MKLKATINNTKQNTTKVISNLVELIEAVSLAIVTGFAIYEALHVQHKTIQTTILLAAGVVVAVIAAHEFLKHLNK